MEWMIRVLLVLFVRLIARAEHSEMTGSERPFCSVSYRQ